MPAQKNIDSNPCALESYDYVLPSRLIASYPANPRESARLLIYNRTNEQITHTSFENLLDFIPRDTTIVLNDTRVIKARIYGKRVLTTHKNSDKNIGGKREILFHRFITKQEILQEYFIKANTKSKQDFDIESSLDSISDISVDSSGLEGQKFYALCQTKGKLKNGDKIILKQGYEAHIIATLANSAISNAFTNGYKIIVFTKDCKALLQAQVIEMLESIGEIPLPPYIKRKISAIDEIQYQTLIASKSGSIAAPTASLHFSQAMLKELKSRFKPATVTLHIGAGTFAPVVASDIRNHTMHKEMLNISPNAIKSIQNANKILCVGSSSMRSVECLAQALKNNPSMSLDKGFETQCDIFLHPQNPPIKTDFLLTNFHLPKSTLIMLVASMVGCEKWRKIYKEAIEKQYRFYSYGDAMLVL